ncbi:TPA: hypothetical protein ACXIEZ_006604 [Pseudomonas aeruginosa]
MKQLTFADAKKDFERGLIASAWLERQPLSDDWVLFFRSQLRTDATMVFVATREREVRLFKSLDAALNILRQIGFKADRLDVK